MSLKEDRRNRSWTSHLLAALFRPFMPEAAPPELPHLLFHSGPRPGGSVPVTNWYLWMLHDRPDNRYLMCLLTHIDYCKCIDGAEHEFLLLYFRHLTSSAEAVVCADRTVERGNGSTSEIISPSPSSKQTAASDHALLLGSPNDAIRHLRDKPGRYKKLCTLTFSPSSAPSVLHVAAILCLVHRQAPAYNLYEKQCFWYADSVWMSLKNIFPQNQESCKDHNARTHYCGVAISGPSSATVEAVCAAYPPEWQKTMDKLAQLKQCCEAELAQSRQEGFAEAEQAAEERVRRVQEAADERVRRVQEAADERVRRVEDEDSYREDSSSKSSDESADEYIPPRKRQRLQANSSSRVLRSSKGVQTNN
ncbi:uncharacterized protein F5891DRAFT_1224779 [Suillus fuscotomentosus]|uniref:Uncharacterized protein n=1 Tax=Suillus fuscotomentosus TaxID=1912939 RepID=A0AAD4DNU7_9AGAM|nr:uncharacterized protein F5891DRAFT_1224779 [Suillus fuscotomentosus]KAG1886877.1 hypothetical protein F5891DRAFT_1224779 [Suillus fuscotomentosus]